MNGEPLDLEQLQAAIQQAAANWVPAETSLLSLSLQEKQLRLGAVPPPGEATFDQREQVARATIQAEIGIEAIGAPASYDLRNVGGQNFITPVQDQRNCGSCVSFGSIATVEGTIRVKRANANLQVDLSEAHLFYCHGASQGRNCGNGWWVDPALEMIKTLGVVDDACYPYTPGDQVCGVCADWQTRVTKISGWRKLTTVADMKTWLSTNGPLAACFKVYEDFFAYRSGVYRNVSGAAVGGHCVCVVGYSDTEKCWICKNSWGKTWGDNGFFRIGYGECGIDYSMWGVEIPALPGSDWLENKQIAGLWSINQERSAAVYIIGTGWLKVSAESDSIFLGMLTLLSSAKTSKALVNVRHQNGVIKEVYVGGS